MVNFLIATMPILINLIVSLLSILATLETSKHTTDTNRKLNEENLKINAENAGKNRTIYGVEVMHAGDGNLKTRLDSGNYTILNAYANPSSWSNTVVVLGKINP